jgi:hypothetical protein
MTHPGKIEHGYREPYVAVPATVLCCPIKGAEHPVTMLCLEQYGRESVYLAWLDPDYPDSLKYGMRDAIRQFWTGEKDLIHVDHDAVFVWENLRDLVNCPGDFCTCPAMSGGKVVTATLAFSKFSAKLQREVNLNVVFAEADTCVDRPGWQGCYGDWWGFEYHLMEKLKRYVGGPCTHLHHLNDHPQYGLETPHDKLLRVDNSTEEGRQAIIDFLHENKGWSTR